jgi:hypothetical protein
MPASHIASFSAGPATTTKTAHASLVAADTTVVTVRSLLLLSLYMMVRPLPVKLRTADDNSPDQQCCLHQYLDLQGTAIGSRSVCTARCHGRPDAEHTARIAEVNILCEVLQVQFTISTQPNMSLRYLQRLLATIALCSLLFLDCILRNGIDKVPTVSRIWWISWRDWPCRIRISRCNYI